MKRLEEERLQALQREEELKKMIETDEVVLNLDKELQSLIAVSASCRVCSYPLRYICVPCMCDRSSRLASH